jgi:hypothetical protein
MSIHVFNATLTKQLQAAFLHLRFACIVQFACTVHANSASELHCSREQCNSLALFGYFFFLVCIVFVYFFFKKN